MVADLDLAEDELLDDADIEEEADDELDDFADLDDDEDEDEPDDEPAERSRAELDDESLRIRGFYDGEMRVAGADVTPGSEQLHHYWTRGKGLAKWAKNPHPWTALYHHLLKYVGAERAKRMAAQWHKEVFGIWPGEKKGQNPVGPG